MNYGKLTAGTTKTAIDTAKPSEKGEIITYLSRMGDVLYPVFHSCNIIIDIVGVGRIKVIIDGNEAYTVFGKGECCVQSSHSRVSAKSGKVFRKCHSHIT